MKRVCFTLLCAPVSSCIVDGSLGSDAQHTASIDAGDHAGPTNDAPASASVLGAEHDAGPMGETASIPDAATPPSCEPSAVDTSCIACQKHQCCPAFTACADHVPCTCVSECLAPEVSVANCQTHCGVSGFDELDELTACAVTLCSAECQ